MNAIEFQTIAHDGVLEIPMQYRRALDGKSVRVLLVDSQSEAGEGSKSLFARLRRVRVQGPSDLSVNHESYVNGDPDA